VTVFRTGWIPDTPDARDYTRAHPAVRPFIERAGIAGEAPPLPAAVDLTADFPSVFNQGALSSCTAATATALVSYFQRRAHGRDRTPSTLFVYKIARNLLGLRGDTGALLRTAMQGLRLFGSVPEHRWPSEARNLDVEPTAFHYLYAANYKARAYYRLDEPGLDRPALLLKVRTGLAARLPAMFGLFLFPSLSFAVDGAIPMPHSGERPQLSHALVAVGYDDAREVRNLLGGPPSRGALKVRNSWGPGWGAGGYGWLPYDYVLQGYTSDWWSLIEADFVDSGQFGLP
jgi:C1A family cysteine protease